jgi:Zn-dependent metalloprotease
MRLVPVVGLVAAATALSLGPAAAPTVAKAQTTKTVVSVPAGRPAEENVLRHQSALALGKRVLPQVEDLAALAPGERLVVRDAYPNDDGTTGLRYDRRFRGLPVDGEQVIVRIEEDGTSVSVVDLPDTTLATVSGITPAVSASSAEEKVADKGPKQRPTTHRSELGVFAMTSPARLAWQVTTLVGSGARQQAVTATSVDALTGVILDQRPLVATGSGWGRWNGQQSFGTMPYYAEFMLRTSRGESTWDWADLPHRVITDADDVWGSSSAPSDGVDAHTGNINAYDYFNGTHGRAGVFGDGNGVPVAINYVPDGETGPWKNAQWTGAQINVGAGEGGDHPWTTLDMMGHEFTHGVTGASAGLVYESESGGLNEGTSDIFGTMAEFAAANARDPGDYRLAEVNLKGLGGREDLRRMDDPAVDGDSPSCYRSDIGGLDVHYSSGPLNHWFYLLAEGTGPKSIGGFAHSSSSCDGPGVTPLGRTKAAAIWYRALTQYLQPNDGYAAARTKSVSATIALHGAAGFECAAVERAWDAVSVPGTSQCTKASVNTSLASTFSTYATASTDYATMCARWTGGDGTQSVLLPSGKRVWYFSDTFLGATGLRPKGFDVSGIRNSMVVQSGSTLRTITGGNTCKERDTTLDFWSRYAKTPVDTPGGNEFYWTGDGMVVGSNVVKFYWRNVPTSDGWWQETHTAIVTTPTSTLDTASVVASSPALVTPSYTYGSNPLVWGAALLETQDYVFIYGTGAIDAAKTRRLYVARTTKSDLANPAAWTYRTSNNGWSTSQSDAAPVSSSFEPSMSFDVIARNGLYWLIQHQPSMNGGAIVAHGSANPYDFTTKAVTLFAPPEGSRSPGNKFVWHYDARVHDISAGADTITVSYNVNTSAKSIGCRSLNDHDGTIYRPRFVTVPVGLLHPDRMTNPPALPASPTSSVASGTGTGGDQNWYDGWAYAGGCPPLKAGMSTLSGTAAASGLLSLSWTPAGRDMWYWIEGRDATANEAFKRGDLWSTGTSFTTYPVDSPLKDGHTFEYRIVPFASGFGGKEAPPTNVWRGVVKIALPSAPTGVTAAPPSGTTGKIKVSWTGVTFPAPQVYYQVFYWDITAGQAVGSKWTAWLGETTRSTTLTLTRGHKYGFYVTAINSAGSSRPSSTVTAVVP